MLYIDYSCRQSLNMGRFKCLLGDQKISHNSIKYLKDQIKQIVVLVLGHESISGNKQNLLFKPHRLVCFYGYYLLNAKITFPQAKGDPEHKYRFDFML